MAFDAHADTGFDDTLGQLIRRAASVLLVVTLLVGPIVAGGVLAWWLVHEPTAMIAETAAVSVPGDRAPLVSRAEIEAAGLSVSDASAILHQ